MPREPGWWYRHGSAMERALAPFAAIYGHLATRRLTHGTPYRSRLPVICVGNFTAGGSGKTPFAAMLAERLIARGERPAILSRGYGGSERGPHWVDRHADPFARVGDEPLLLARIAPVMVSRDRKAGAIAIEAAGAHTVIVMDDGLQNPALAKDLSFAVIDGARLLGNRAVIPAGPLRAPLDVQLPLVHAIVYNGPVDGPGSEHFEDEIAGRRSIPQLHARLTASGVRLGGQRLVAYAGIGNPDRFFDTVRSLGATLVEAAAFPDHARFSDGDATRLLASAARHAAGLITTEKDHVRLSGSARLAELAAASAVLPVRMSLADGEESVLDGLLRSLFQH